MNDIKNKFNCWYYEWADSKHFGGKKEFVGNANQSTQKIDEEWLLHPGITISLMEKNWRENQ